MAELATLAPQIVVAIVMVGMGLFLARQMRRNGNGNSNGNEADVDWVKLAGHIEQQAQRQHVTHADLNDLRESMTKSIKAIADEVRGLRQLVTNGRQKT